MRCLHSFKTINRLESHKKASENNDFCGTVDMPSEDTKTFGFNQERKSNNTPSIIYANIQSLIKKVDGCKNNLKNHSHQKISEHISCRYSMSTIWTFDCIKNKHDVCRGEDCMKKFCESLREHAIR